MTTPPSSSTFSPSTATSSPHHPAPTEWIVFYFGIALILTVAIGICAFSLQHGLGLFNCFCCCCPRRRRTREERKRAEELQERQTELEAGDSSSNDVELDDTSEAEGETGQS
jgi:hypothetical protein